MDFDKCIQEIYDRIQDKESKFIFASRLDYSLTHDPDFLCGMVDQTVRNRKEWVDLCNYLVKLSSDAELVIFGSGIWGGILCSETKNRGVRWKAVIDSNPKRTILHDIPVISFDNFFKDYKGEYIVISSYKSGYSMKEQLQRQGICKGKIVDAGSVIYALTEKAIYFSLHELLPVREREVFVDAGCFDGQSSKAFFEWCGQGGYSYCFEPDRQNWEKIGETLKEYGNYEVIPKALWSKETTLAINAKGNFASTVTEISGDSNVQRIGAMALDDCFYNKGVTFIKMDIEGAEIEALRGARKIIEKQKPRLAVSIYHNPEDIWTLPREILSYCPEYRFYLRHYSFSDYDTVLYAIP